MPTGAARVKCQNVQATEPVHDLDSPGTVGGCDAVVRCDRLGAERAAVAPIHHRSVPRHHVDQRCVVLRRRVAHSLLVEQHRHLEQDSDIFPWNAGTRALTHLTPHQGEAQFSPATFDPASRDLYYLSNDGSEFTRLRRYSPATGAHEDVEKVDWDITFASFSHNGRYRVTGVNRDGRATISVVETATGKPVALPAIPNGGVGGVSFARSEARLAFYVNGDRSPRSCSTRSRRSFTRRRSASR